MNTTSTYSILEVSRAAFTDVRTRLEAAGVLGDYWDQDGEKRPLIVFGTVALKAEAQTELALPVFPLIELREVPVYDAPGLPEEIKQILQLSPWQRGHNAKPTFDNELAGILAAFGALLVSVGEARRKISPEEFAKAAALPMAEIVNLILLCGGKVPQ
jgi:hypothetical protein